MHAIQTHHLLFDLAGAKTATKLGKNRQTAFLKSFGIGVAALAIVAFAGCQQFAGEIGEAPLAQPAVVAQEIFEAHDSSWISQAHALAAKGGSEAAVPDLSY